MKLLPFLFAAALLPLPDHGQDDLPELPELERHRVEMLCAGMETQVHLRGGGWADCVSDNHAIEVDYTHRWADAIGQSLYYASELELLPGMILVCHRDRSDSACYGHVNRVASTFSYWTISMTVWVCGTDSRTLDDCTREEFWGPN